MLFVCARWGRGVSTEGRDRRAFQAEGRIPTYSGRKEHRVFRLEYMVQPTRSMWRAEMGTDSRHGCKGRPKLSSRTVLKCTFVSKREVVKLFKQVMRSCNGVIYPRKENCHEFHFFLSHKYRWN